MAMQYEQAAGFRGRMRVFWRGAVWDWWGCVGWVGQAQSRITCQCFHLGGNANCHEQNWLMSRQLGNQWKLIELNGNYWKSMEII